MGQTIINHDLRSVNGKYIQMPAYKGGQAGWGNLNIPSPYAEGVTQLYPIGTRFVDDDRTFRYVQAGNAGTVGRLLTPWNRFGTATSGDGTTAETGTIQAAGVVADTYITLTDQGSATPANVFAGGYCTIYWEFIVRRIESNTAEDDPSAGLFRIYLDTPLDMAIDAASVVTCYRDKYADVRYTTSGSDAVFSPAVCASVITHTDTYFGWGQTWGPCGIAGVDNAGAGSTESAFFNTQGAVYFQGSLTSSDTAHMQQYIGASACYTGDGAGGATGVDQPGALIFLNLQLAP